MHWCLHVVFDGIPDLRPLASTQEIALAGSWLMGPAVSMFALSFLEALPSSF